MTDDVYCNESCIVCRGLKDCPKYQPLKKRVQQPIIIEAKNSIKRTSKSDTIRIVNSDRANSQVRYHGKEYRIGEIFEKSIYAKRKNIKYKFTILPTNKKNVFIVKDFSRV